MSNDFISGMQRGFIECAEWAEGESIAANDPESLYHEGNGFSEAAIQEIDQIVVKFYNENKELLESCGLTAEQCGHDFYLTAQGHGAGFWDRGIGETGEKLTEACKSYGFDIYANENGLLEV